MRPTPLRDYHPPVQNSCRGLPSDEKRRGEENLKNLKQTIEVRRQSIATLEEAKDLLNLVVTRIGFQNVSRGEMVALRNKRAVHIFTLNTKQGDLIYTIYQCTTATPDLQIVATEQIDGRPVNQDVFKRSANLLADVYLDSVINPTLEPDKPHAPLSKAA